MGCKGHSDRPLLLGPLSEGEAGGARVGLGAAMLITIYLVPALPAIEVSPRSQRDRSIRPWPLRSSALVQIAGRSRQSAAAPVFWTVG
jgi:hypothetical protein